MTTTDRIGIILLTALMVGLLMFFSINIGRNLSMGEAKYTLSTYTGVGSGVYKHGTIVKVVDDRPVVVGHFDDDSGKEYPGTVQIEEVK